MAKTYLSVSPKFVSFREVLDSIELLGAVDSFCSEYIKYDCPLFYLDTEQQIFEFCFDGFISISNFKDQFLNASSVERFLFLMQYAPTVYDENGKEHELDIGGTDVDNLLLPTTIVIRIQKDLDINLINEPKPYELLAVCIGNYKYPSSSESFVISQELIANNITFITDPSNHEPTTINSSEYECPRIDDEGLIKSDSELKEGGIQLSGVACRWNAMTQKKEGVEHWEYILADLIFKGMPIFCEHSQTGRVYLTANNGYSKNFALSTVKDATSERVLLNDLINAECELQLRKHQVKPVVPAQENPIKNEDNSFFLAPITEPLNKLSKHYWFLYFCEVVLDYDLSKPLPDGAKEHIKREAEKLNPPKSAKTIESYFTDLGIYSEKNTKPTKKYARTAQALRKAFEKKYRMQPNELYEKYSRVKLGLN